MDCATGSAGSDDVAIKIHDDTPTGFLIDAGNEDFKDLVKRKRGESFHRLGGAARIAAALFSSPESGICGDNGDLLRRQEAFGRNEYPKSKPNSLFKLMRHAIWDAGVIVLLVRAIVSFGYGIIMNHGIQDGWYGAVPVLIAALLVAAVSAASTYCQAKRSTDLASKSSAQVIRGGRWQEVSMCDLVVGDVVPLKTGDVVPADGVFLHGDGLLVDESSMTGEQRPVEVDANNTPFLTSGARVADGYGSMLVTAVGTATAFGEMMSRTTREKTDPTAIQEFLQDISKSIISRVGPALIDRKHMTIIVIFSAFVGQAIAIPQDLVLGLTLMLSFTMKRMAEDGVLVRRVSACEAMGSVTAICTDKKGTLTLNQLKVDEFWVGTGRPKAVADINDAVVTLLRQGAGLNTSGSVNKPDNVSPPEISGSPTEKALLTWAVEDLGMDNEALNRRSSLVRVEAFNSDKKRAGVLIRDNATGAVTAHWKGAAEAVLANCSAYVDTDGASRELDADKRKKVEEIISEMAATSLRCIAFAYKPVDGDSGDFSKIDDEGLTLLAFVGLKDPCRPGARTAVEACMKAGVRVTMITGDNLSTARAIAKECGIISNDDDHEGIAIEGQEFRNMSLEQKMEIADRIRVMARAHRNDKLLLVKALKKRDHVVAVTGDGNADAPALRAADIGLFLGTEVAKESSDIIILDDDYFSTVVKATRWGRHVFVACQKFIQFQLTVNVAALIINIVVAITSGKMPLTAERLLWVNLAMDTLGALALATDLPTDALMRCPPVGLKEPLISNSMWRNLLAQAAYQVAAVLGLHYRGRDIFGTSEVENGAMIFAAFVLCQVFNLFNAREIERKNVFAGVLRNWMFLAIVAALLAVQAVMVGVLTRLSGTGMLRSGQWGACVAIAAMSWPIGWAVKFIPVPDRSLHEILARWKCF